jgi:hypothetical protein
VKQSRLLTIQEGAGCLFDGGEIRDLVTGNVIRGV